MITMREVRGVHNDVYVMPFKYRHSHEIQAMGNMYPTQSEINRNIALTISFLRILFFRVYINNGKKFSIHFGSMYAKQPSDLQELSFNLSRYSINIAM